MKELKISGKIFAVIFSIVYFLVLTMIIFLGLAGKLTSGNYYTKVLDDIDLNEIKLSDIGDFSENGKLSNDTSVKEAIVEFFKEGGVDENTANTIMENKEIKTIMGNYIGDYVNYNLGGEEPQISKEDVETVLKNSEVTNAIGRTPTEQEINNVYDSLKEISQDIIKRGGVKNDNTRTNNEINSNY